MTYPNTSITVDGLWGPETIYAFQVWARRRNWYPSSYLLDGVEGHGTRTAIQRWLKAEGYYSGEIDGIIGSLTMDAMRRSLDAKVDWSFTVYDRNGKVIGRHDGKLKKASSFPHPDYVAKLQTYLNRMR